MRSSNLGWRCGSMRRLPMMGLMLLCCACQASASARGGCVGSAAHGHTLALQCHCGLAAPTWYPGALLHTLQLVTAGQLCAGFCGFLCTALSMSGREAC
jgi:hypothetical protein